MVIKTKAPVPEVSSDRMDRLMALCALKAQAEVLVVAAEDRLKAAKEHLRLIEEEDIPGLMLEINLDEVRLTSGVKIAVTNQVEAGITKANEEPAFEWLDTNGFGGIIKTELKMLFNRDTLPVVKELVEELQAAGWEPEVKLSVHWQTLRAFVKEQLALGEKAVAPIPFETFGVRQMRVAKVTQPKKALK